MKWFFLIYLLILLACGNIVFILNANRTQDDDGDALYEESFSSGFGFMSAFLNQFLVSVG